MKLVYVAHPYGGDEKNAQAVKQIIEDLTEGNHPLLANPTAPMTPTVPAVHARISITTTDLMQAVYVSPIHQQGFMYAGTPYLAGLQKCLELLRRCDILLLCGDWQNSKGCLAEFGFAMARKMPIVFENSNDYYDLI